MSKRHFRIAATVWAGGIIVSTMIRGSDLGHRLQTLGPQHIVLHIGVFAVLGALLLAGFESRMTKVALLFLAVLLGLATETYEHLVFGNVMENRDVLFDVVGVLVGGLTGSFISQRWATVRG